MDLTRKITLMSADGETFHVDQAVALQSQTIKNLIEDVSADDGIPVPNVTGKILDMVIEFCKGRDWAPECRAWDKEFFEFYHAHLCDLILAANYLNIKSLLDLTCQTAADMLKGKNPDEIRRILGVEIDFTPEEQEKVRRENQWAYE